MTFEERIDLCNRVNEGCELEDAIKQITCAASILSDFSYYEHEALLLIAENLCRGYVKNNLWARDCTWDDYNECPEDVYKYFTGGARKLTKKEFNNDL